ncbi:SRPBCC domain-containing protein [Sphingomonas sp. MG17]|uniref:SRPBCC domain-containing protein n=1 Tax=Sphingomonas tagetis TaxID=2949092 RepID=A0A9X2KJW9_9SPHN|nr:SRPBCC domain-containing protein [Sphingomonas tagetis]MCP3729145.1 SRPBCC domain-containing protein [Sphingomonas tagetis]
MTDTRITPVFMIQRRFSAPIERVFDAWADPAQMAAWAGPTGAQLTVLSGEIAEGATMHARQDTADGGAMFTIGRYLELRRPHRLVYDQSFADEAGNVTKAPFFDHWPHVLRTEVDLAEDGDGTRLTLRWTPIGATPDEEAQFASIMDSMTGGWSGSFDKLDAFLAG